MIVFVSDVVCWMIGLVLDVICLMLVGVRFEYIVISCYRIWQRENRIFDWIVGVSKESLLLLFSSWFIDAYLFFGLMSSLVVVKFQWTFNLLRYVVTGDNYLFPD